MVRLFKWFMVVMSGLLVVWWLNVPFLDSPKDTAPIIVTSTPILADLTQQLVGPDVHVISLTERVSDPSKQQITKQKLEKIKEASLVIVNGSQIEKGMVDLKPYLSEKAHLINVGNIMTKYDKGWQSYYWMSPVSWNKLVHYIQMQFKRVFPDRRSEINYRKMAYTNDIYTLHQTLKKTMDEVRQKNKVISSNHESFAPFAKAFGFEFVTLNLTDNMDEETLSKMVDTLKKRNVKVFYPNEALPQVGIDDLVKTALAQGWQLRIGKPVISLNLDMEGSGVSSYIEMMTFNLRALSDS
ncbi:hypothetical protein DID73_02425 [Candidatus Marinamargulisbacteria bacterium SCGC AG-343-K17]|nr:hypothetical protein DID73_02425 [Candidatus Marinamargulisbacteria bacterium SCGC AG-343-K17]